MNDRKPDGENPARCFYFLLSYTIFPWFTA